MITYRCIKCGTSLQNPDSDADTEDSCPVCKAVYRVPAPPLAYKCPSCGAKLESPGELAGREDVCPLCHEACPVPMGRRKKAEEKERLQCAAEEKTRLRRAAEAEERKRRSGAARPTAGAADAGTKRERWVLPAALVVATLLIVAVLATLFSLAQKEGALLARHRAALLAQQRTALVLKQA